MGKWKLKMRPKRVGQNYLLTEDRITGRLDPADLDLLQSVRTGEGLVRLTPEMAVEIGRRLHEMYQAFRAEMAGMTAAQAAQVRAWRYLGGYSMRAVARAYKHTFGGSWEPDSHQAAGMAVIDRAQQYYPDEDWTPEETE
jgi:hypothetical protein